MYGDSHVPSSPASCDANPKFSSSFRATAPPTTMKLVKRISSPPPAREDKPISASGLKENAVRALSATSTLFGGTTSETNPPTQGSLFWYKDSSCYYPLSYEGVPLIFGQCQNLPPTVKGLSVNTKPDCPDYGVPLAVAYPVANCDGSAQNATLGGDPYACAALESYSYATGQDIASIEFRCYGTGIEEPEEPEDKDGGDSSCCCCCVVM